MSEDRNLLRKFIKDDEKYLIDLISAHKKKPGK